MQTFFTDTDEMDFDGEDFLGLGKKARAKRQRKKQLRNQGLSRKDARRQAKDELKSGVIVPIGRGEKVVANVNPSLKATARRKVKQLQAANIRQVTSRGNDIVGVNDGGYEVEVTESGVVMPTSRMAEGDLDTGMDMGMDGKPNYLLIGGIALVVVVGGYFALRK
tara:strand:- start:206 stop:700 length:495 start_codon:yes stop_codon:yes gene_type:complete